MWNPFSHLLDLSHGFQTYGDGFLCYIQLIRELLLSLSIILIQQCNSLSSNFFGGFPSSSFLTSKLSLLNFLNTQSTVIYQEYVHHKLRQAFDAILQQFSSNSNRKSMLSANRFQAQNSTCSTLLQIILLYETCELKIFVRCQNKEWRQWRRLTATTLTVMAIYW